MAALYQPARLSDKLLLEGEHGADRDAGHRKGQQVIPYRAIHGGT
jgi:hypothetical protein